MRLRITGLLMLIFCWGEISIAQLDTEGSPIQANNSVGLFLAVGTSIAPLPEGDPYVPILAGAMFHFPAFSITEYFNIGFDVVPHAAVVTSTIKLNYEFGINAGFSLDFILSDSDMLSFKVGSGPHWISVETGRQAKGFIFSDNFTLNYDKTTRTPQRGYSIGLLAGFRHISNAGLVHPNVGLGNFILGIKIAKPL